MSYSSLETSQEAGAPLEIYEFSYQAITYRYVNGVDEVTVDSVPYLPFAVQRGSISNSDDPARENLSIRLASTHPVVDLFRVQPPSSVVSVTIRRRHAGDTELVVLWKGRVLSVSWDQPGEAVLNCEPISTSLRRPGLTRKYSRSCPLELYSAACGAVEDDHKFTIESFAWAPGSTTVNVPALAGVAVDRYAGGFLRYKRADINADEYRFIKSSDTLGNLVLATAPTGLSASSEYVYALPGCKHTITACHEDFNNRVNYGGQPYFPGNNPFNGATVF